jgi:2-keto-4-pentenoate hydratase/2-oxohepta-3-ene-1,7-dioic acid hydratase in catechol pathway
LVQAGIGGLAAARDGQVDAHALRDVKLDAPLRNPSKVVCIALNYLDFARSGGLTPPDRPMCLAKFPSSIVGPGDQVSWSPEVAARVDYEAELVVVMGQTARNVPRERALDYVFGYTCGNDISARDLQERDGQWVRSKSLDTFGPLGPWIVTADEIADPQDLGVRCVLNGLAVQDSSTREMVFGVAALIEFLSRSFTLLPGDLIFTGTPAGVGVFRKPPLYLNDGDQVVVEIDKIGQLVNRCRTLPAQEVFSKGA